MTKKDFISAIGYDGAAAVVNKARREKNAGKNLSQLLEEGSFRSAAALALYNGSEEELKMVADHYNALSGAQYTAASIARVFGLSKSDAKKIIAL